MSDTTSLGEGREEEEAAPLPSLHALSLNQWLPTGDFFHECVTGPEPIWSQINFKIKLLSCLIKTFMFISFSGLRDCAFRFPFKHSHVTIIKNNNKQQL